MTIGLTGKRAFHSHIVKPQNMSSLFCPYSAHAGTDGVSTWLMKTGVTHLWWGRRSNVLLAIYGSTSVPSSTIYLSSGRNARRELRVYFMMSWFLHFIMQRYYMYLDRVKMFWIFKAVVLRLSYICFSNFIRPKKFYVGSNDYFMNLNERRGLFPFTLFS